MGVDWCLPKPVNTVSLVSFRVLTFPVRLINIPARLYISRMYREHSDFKKPGQFMSKIPLWNLNECRMKTYPNKTRNTT